MLRDPLCESRNITGHLSSGARVNLTSLAGLQCYKHTWTLLVFADGPRRKASGFRLPQIQLPECLDAARNRQRILKGVSFQNCLESSENSYLEERNQLSTLFPH